MLATQPLASTSRNTALGATAALAAGTTGGIGGVMIAGVSGLASAPGWRLLLGTLVLFPIVLLGRKHASPITMTRAAWLRVGIGGALFAAALGANFQAAHRTGVATWLCIGAAAPAVSAVADRLVLGTRLRRSQLGLVLVVAVGAALPAISAAREGTFLGAVFAVLTMLFSTAYALTARSAAPLMTSREFLLRCTAIATVVWIPVMVTQPLPSRSDWVGIALITLIPGTLGGWLVVEANRRAPMAVAAACSLVSLPVGAIVAYLAAGQVPTSGAIVGSVVVAFGVVALTALSTRRIIESPDAFIDIVGEEALEAADRPGIVPATR